MRKFPKPVVVVSACLEFEKVRYDGQVIPCKIENQTLLEPYPKELMVTVELGRDKDYWKSDY